MWEKNHWSKSHRIEEEGESEQKYLLLLLLFCIAAVRNGNRSAVEDVLPGILFHTESKQQCRPWELLNELHHLYERQKDLMNEIKSKELLIHQKVARISQSTFSSSGFPTGDDRKSWHISNLALLDSSYGRQSTSSTCISQPPCDSIEKPCKTAVSPTKVE
ncbi:unnamed protein product [Malus baccata var. baccata]